MTFIGPTPMDLLAAADVTRWHTTATARNQTLADHQGMVASLADHLGQRLGSRYSPYDALLTLRWALAHDLPETEHGDIPNPSKAWLDNRMVAGGCYDHQVAKDWWNARGCQRPLPTPLAEDLVSIADKLEACCWYWRFGLTPRRGSSARDLREEMVFEALRTCRVLLPELQGPVSECLTAAGVPDSLIAEASA
jgi:hypothetical protein